MSSSGSLPRSHHAEPEHLSGIARLAPHLSRENAGAVLARASGMSHREIRELVAELPLPDVATSIRKLPERSATLKSESVLPTANESFLELGAPRVEPEVVKLDCGVAAPARSAVPARPLVVEPLAPARYQVRFTASAALRDKLERLQALMRASVPDGDLTRIIEIAVSEKLERVEAKRFGRTQAPRSLPPDADPQATPS